MVNKYQKMPSKVKDINKIPLYVRLCYRCGRYFKTSTKSNKALCRECCKLGISSQIGDYLDE